MMIPAPTRISIPSIVAARLSTFSWPYGCSASAGSPALRTDTKATTEAIRSIREWTASVMIAIDPVIAPAAILIAIRVEFDVIDRAAAPLLVRIMAARRPPGDARQAAARRSPGG